MEIKYIDKYKDLEKIIDSINETEHKIDVLLKRFGGTGLETTRESFLRTVIKEKPYQNTADLDDLLTSTGQLVVHLDLLKKQIHAISTSKQTEINENKRKLCRDRIEDSKTWFVRLLRWTLGAFAAVLVYSTVVWASESWDFVKVPVKDIVEKAIESEPS